MNTLLKAILKFCTTNQLFLCMWYENLICLLKGNYLIYTVVDGDLEPHVRIQYHMLARY